MTLRREGEKMNEGWASGRIRGTSRRARCAAVALVLGIGGLVVAAVGGGSVQAAAPSSTVSRAQLARLLLDHGHSRFATAPAQRALQLTAGVTQSPGRGIGADAQINRSQPAIGGPAAVARAGLPNVRVNNPALDTHQTDQTTQSETTIAVSGRHVAVGFNDSQQALFTLTDGFDFTGYSYSTNGGKTFTDGGTLPNPLNFVNSGDPWMASDRAGRMYYGTLTYGGDVGNLEVGVGRSTNGGRSWSAPTLASPNNDDLFYSGDKDAVATGRDPKLANRDNVYVAWDDQVFNPNSDTGFNGLPVATSTNHGASWSLHYADKITVDPDSCSFAQYIGAQPLVNPANGTLYLAAEKIAVDDPDCSFTAPATLSEVIFKSTDGGVTFGKAVAVAHITAASPTGALQLGPGQFVRTAEFPVLAIRGNTLWLAWNDGGSGRSHIKLATSTASAQTWRISSVTSGSGDEIQPAIAADAAGLHIAYYQRNADNTLDTVVSDSTDAGTHFTARAVTSHSFPGVHTVPQFDPQVAFTYMGDYIALVSDGAHQYFVWGDNRDRIVNFTHPHGRHDPDVFFARR
jgi:hypothetical protein